jgi:hypothetical protein
MVAVAGVTAMAVIVFPGPTLTPPHPRLNKDTASRSVKSAQLDKTTLEAFIIGRQAPQQFSELSIEEFRSRSPTPNGLPDPPLGSFDRNRVIAAYANWFVVESCF